MQARQHDIGRFAQPAQSFGRRRAAGLDEVVGQFAGQQHAVTVETALAVGFVGEAVAGIALVMGGDALVDFAGIARILPAHVVAQTGNGEGDDVIVVGMVDQVVVVRIDEHAPVEAHAQLGQGQAVDGLIQQAGALQLVERQDVIIGAPGVVGVIDGQFRDLAEVLQVIGQARIVLGQGDDIVGKTQRDLAGQELVVAVEHRLAVDDQ